MSVSKRVAVWVAVLLCNTALSVARGAPIYIPDLPDFYQHQWSGSSAVAPYNNPGAGTAKPFALPGGAGGAYANPATPSYVRAVPVANAGPGVQWENTGGWCWPASFTDILYQLDHHGAAGLFTHTPGLGDPAAPTWLQRMTYAIEDTEIKMFNPAVPVGSEMDTVINSWVGPNRVHHDVYTWNGAVAVKNGVATTLNSMFTVYRQQLANGHDVLIRIDGTPTAPAWWATSYHQIAGSGYDSTNGTVYYADPNNAGSGAAGANWGHPYAAGAVLPVGAAFYDSGRMNADGTFSTGAYAGAGFEKFDVFYVVPEPGTWLTIIMGGCMALVFQCRRTIR